MCLTYCCPVLCRFIVLLPLRCSSLPNTAPLTCKPQEVLGRCALQATTSQGPGIQGRDRLPFTIDFSGFGQFNNDDFFRNFFRNSNLGQGRKLKSVEATAAQ